MAQETMERRVENIERRLTTVEQILPTLATKADLKAAVASLATKAEVRAEIQAAVRAEGIETRRHFDVVAEGLRTDIRKIAEGIVAVQARCDIRHHDVMDALTRHDRRLTRLEAAPLKRR